MEEPSSFLFEQLLNQTAPKSTAIPSCAPSIPAGISRHDRQLLGSFEGLGLRPSKIKVIEGTSVLQHQSLLWEMGGSSVL